MNNSNHNFNSCQLAVHTNIPLYEQLPLQAPLAMLIDPSNICNFQCSFCPTGDKKLLKSVNRPKGTMDLGLFYKIIDDIKHMVSVSNQRLKKLLLYKDGEPLINKNFSKMVAYAKKQQVAESIETTSNISLLTKQKSKDIIDAGLDEIRISIEHVTNNGYKGITGTYSNYEKIKNNVRVLYNEKIQKNSSLRVFVKIIDINLSEEEKHRFREDFTPISDFLHISELMGWSKSEVKDFTLGKREHSHAKQIQICPKPFYTLAVNFNGKVSICCVDWSLGTIVGDMTYQSLLDIWNGNKLHNFRMLHLKGKRKLIKVCAFCRYLDSSTSLDDILDDHAEELIEMFS